MSVATRRALYGKMAGDTTLNALLAAAPAGYSKSIYYEQAPQGAAFPYVLFAKQAGTPTYGMGDKAYDDEMWLIKGVGRDTEQQASADGVDNIASRLEALLVDGTLSISGKTKLYLRRESDVDYAEEIDGNTYRHAGSIFRLTYQ